MDDVLKQLITVQDPLTEKTLSQRVTKIKENIVIQCPYPVADNYGTNSKQLLAAITQATNINPSAIQLSFKAPDNNQITNTNDKRTPVKSVANLIAIGSGKGGVGKSTIACGIAQALHTLGAKVGLLDADIYGANQHLLMGLPAQSRLQVNKEKNFIPFDITGMQLISFAGVTETDMPVVWRGPMISSALQQLALKTQWSELDYLVVDLPPGTGDIQLTLFQQIVVAGFVLITTPQAMSVEEAKKTLAMIEKFDVDCLGIVENMNRFICSNCGDEHTIFGNNAQQLVEQTKLPLLSSMPLEKNLHDNNGKLLFDANSNSGKEYISIAEKITIQLAKNSIAKKGSVIASG